MQLTLLQHFVVENRNLGFNNAMHEVFATTFFFLQDIIYNIKMQTR